MALRALVVVLLAAASSGCFSAGSASARYTGSSPRSDAALREAERDLGCPIAQLRIVVETGRRYVNESSFRFVIEGCGERAGYVEECELVGSSAPAGWTTIDGALACRYLLVTRVRPRTSQDGPAQDR